MSEWLRPSGFPIAQKSMSPGEQQGLIAGIVVQGSGFSLSFCKPGLNTHVLEAS